MSLKIEGRFSEEDTKILSDGIGVYDSVYVDTPDGNFASSEHGRSGLADAIELWKLIDEKKSIELKEVWDEVFDDNNYIEDEGYWMTVEQVQQTADLLNELNERLGEIFTDKYNDWRVIRRDKIAFIRKTIPHFKIETESDGEGGVDYVVLNEMWNFNSAWRFINVAARLGREVSLS